jgi:L-threonylcarbamoyladenylate synthase
MIFEEDIKNSLRALKAGGVILYPTDTVWGLGCDATNSQAVEKIFSIKSRSESKSLIILVDSIPMLERYVKEIPSIASELIEVSETPITIIYPKARNLAAGIAAEDGSVGIRVCNDKFCNELIGRLRKPVVSTSANISGESSPSNFGEITQSIINSVDYTVFYNREDRQKHRASPVIKVEINGEIKVLRK